MDFLVDSPRLAEEPAVCAAEFGMRPNCDDNAPALQAAIDFCREQGRGRLLIGPGVFHLRNTDYITLREMQDFLLDGRGAELIFHEPYFFLIDRCLRIEVAGLTVDYSWDRGRIGSLVRVLASCPDTRTLTLEFFELETAEASITVSSFNPFDPVLLSPGVANAKEIWLSDPTVLTECTRPAPNQVTFRYTDGQLDALQAGEVYMATHLWQRRGCAFYINDSQHTTMTMNTIYSALGNGHLIAGASQYFRFNGVRIMLRPGSNRHVSTAADGIHIIQSLGYCLIEHCDFSFMGDDCVNIHDCHFSVREQRGDRELLLDNGAYGQPDDRLELLAPDFSPVGAALTLDSYENLPSGGGVLRTKEPIPEGLAEGAYLVNRSFGSTNYIIRDNYFHENRARGLLLQCGGGRVEHNRFYRQQGASIYVMCETLEGLWYEGSGVDGLTVERNLFYDCNCADWSSVIDIAAIIKDNTSLWPLYRNIRIAHNQFMKFPGRVLLAATATDVEFKHNRMYMADKTPCTMILERCDIFTEEDNLVGELPFDTDGITVTYSHTHRRHINYFKPLYDDTE